MNNLDSKLSLIDKNETLLIERNTYLDCSKEECQRKIIILTDLEPDDRKALDVFGSIFTEKNILFVGATVLQSERKRALVKKVLSQIGLSNVPVYQGTGGSSESYPQVNSTKAAKTYQREGKGILSDNELESLSQKFHSSSELQEKIKKALENAEEKSIEFAILAPPTDLVKVLNDSPQLGKKIKQLHIMGGWGEIKENEEIIRRSTYNWDMDPVSSAELMQMTNIPMTLYSSHVFRTTFEGGTINSKNSPDLINHMIKLRSHIPSLNDAFMAGESWNKHVINTIPILKDIIEPFLDHQFTPADPAVAVGMIRPDFITKVKQVKIKIDLKEKSEKGYRVYVEDDPLSNITLVEKMDPKVFKDEMIAVYDRLLKN